MYYSVGKASGDQIFLIMWSSSDNLLQIVTGPTQQLNSDKLCLKVFNWWTDMVQNLAEYKQWTEGVGFCIGWSCLRLFVPLVTQACSAVTSTRWRLYQPTFDPCVGFKGFVQPYGLRAVCNQQQGRKCKDRTIPQYEYLSMNTSVWFQGWIEGHSACRWQLFFSAKWRLLFAWKQLPARLCNSWKKAIVGHLS